LNRDLSRRVEVGVFCEVDKVVILHLRTL
jgi:hypothetical protein